MTKIIHTAYYLFALLSTFGCLLTSAVAQDSPARVTVGAILALSGDAAAMGQAFKNGFELGLSHLPPAIRERITVHYEDDGLSPKNAVTALKKLEADGGVDLVFSFFSASALALSPIIESKKITMLSIAADPTVVKGRRYAFNFWMTPDVATEKLLSEAVSRGYKNVGIVSASHSGVVAYRESFDKLNNNRLKVVLDEEYSPDTKDFRSFIAKLKTKKEVDAVLVILLPGQIGLFTKQARAAGYSKDFVGIELFEDKSEVATSDGAMIDQWYVNSDTPTDEFQNEYQIKFPTASQYTAANGYDAALLLGDALKNGHGRATLNTYFQNLKDFKGALGTYSSSGDQRFTLPAAIKVVRQGGFEKVR